MDKRLIGKNDLIMIGVLVVCGLLIAGALFLTKKDGNEVVVSVDGEVVASFPLDKDIEYEIQGYESDSCTNKLVIKDGEAYMAEANCPDHLCMGMGKISQVGQSIICLPNRVVVEITGDDKESEYDVIGG